MKYQERHVLPQQLILTPRQHPDVLLKSRQHYEKVLGEEENEKKWGRSIKIGF